MDTKVFFLAILHLSFTVACAQPTRFIERTNGNYSERIEVLMTDKSIKHGKYIKISGRGGVGKFYDPDKAIIGPVEEGQYDHNRKTGKWVYRYRLFYGKEEGPYVNDVRHGLWMNYFPADFSGTLRPRMGGYYEQGKKVGQWVVFDEHENLVQQYNFSTARLEYEKGPSDIDSVGHVMNHGVAFFGGATELRYRVLDKCNPAKLFGYRSNDFSRIKITVTVSPLGKVVAIKSALIGADKAGEKLEKAVTDLAWLIEGDWIAASENGEFVEGEYDFVITMYRTFSGHTQKLQIKFEGKDSPPSMGN